MSTTFNNPFQSIDVSIPKTYSEEVDTYCQTSAQSVKGPRPADSPFHRKIDFWFLALCIAAHNKVEPVKFLKKNSVKIIDGSIFSRDSWRIVALQLLAVGYTGDLDILLSPRKIMEIASGLAAAGIPILLELLKGDDVPLWNVTDKLLEMISAPRPNTNSTFR